MYTLLIWMVSLALKVAALWNEKIRLFVDGRKKLFSRIEAAVKGYDDIIWFHVASMGEFEEARPVMEEIRRRFPERKILLTIFSPTGYTHRKNWKTADWVFCLPLDTWFNARRFVRIVRPSKAVFTKGEFWFNYLGRLKRNHVDTYIMSLLASKDSPYLKWYGWPYRRVLKTVYKCVMVKDRKTESALLEFGCRNVEVTGDARIDRVMKIAAEDWHDRIVETWAGGRKAAVAGSSGERENGLFISLLKDYPQDKFLFVPYKPDEAEIRHIVDSAPYGAVLYSDVEYIFSSGMPGNARAGIEETVRKAQVMVVNKIGILSRLYRYGWCALIGGGFGFLTRKTFMTGSPDTMAIRLCLSRQKRSTKSIARTVPELPDVSRISFWSDPIGKSCLTVSVDNQNYHFSIIYRISRFHVKQSASLCFRIYGHAFSVFADEIVINSSFSVILQFFGSYVENGFFWEIVTFETEDIPLPASDELPGIYFQIVWHKLYSYAAFGRGSAPVCNTASDCTCTFSAGSDHSVIRYGSHGNVVAFPCQTGG